MEKRISLWSYWAGVGCVVLTIILRLLAAVDIVPRLVPESGGANISYYTFLRGGILLLLLSIASRQMANSGGGK